MSQRFDHPPSQEPIGSSHKSWQQSRFDQQATHFDARAGVPHEAARATAQVLRQLAARTAGQVVVDIGAGTGSLGSSVVGAGVRYLGLDISLPMLQIFATKLTVQPPLSSRALLVAADADADWPLRASSTTVVFFSRAVHLLQLAHVVRESLRVAHPEGAFLVIGQVRRSPQSIRTLLRKELHEILSRHGVAGKKGEEARKRLIVGLEAQGCRVREPGPRTVATWAVEESPATSLDSWRGKEGLAGTPLPAPIQQAILAELEQWARAQFGNLHEAHTAREHYDLTIVELNPRSPAEPKGEDRHS